MLFSKFYKIVVNKDTFVSFKGVIIPIALLWIHPWYSMHLL